MDLVAAVADIVQVVPRRTNLTDRLAEFRFEPPNDGAAALSLFVSSSEVVFCAGVGARVELDAPGRAGDDVLELASSVAGGRFTEVIGRHRVRFSLDRPDGTTIASGSVSRRALAQASIGTHRYAPYQRSTGDGIG